MTGFPAFWAAMFLQSVDLMALYQLSGGPAHLSGRDASLLMLTCKQLCGITAVLVKSLAVNEMYGALVKTIRLMSPWSETYLTNTSCYFIRREADSTCIVFVVRRCVESRTLSVRSNLFAVTVRPSVFKDPVIMAERLLAVNRFSATLLAVFRHSYGEIQPGRSSFFCIHRREDFTQISFIVTRSVELGTVKLVSKRNGHPYVTVVHPTISRVLMAPPYTGRFIHTNARTGRVVQSVFSFQEVLYIHGYPRAMDDWHVAPVVQTD